MPSSYRDNSRTIVINLESKIKTITCSFKFLLSLIMTNILNALNGL